MSLRVLIVEDEQDLLDIYELKFERQGFECDLADTGDVALQFLSKNSYDLIFSDVKIPGSVDGFALYEYTKRNNIQTPIILNSGHAKGSDELAEAEKAGLLVLTKPVDFDLLFKQLDQILKEAS